MKFEYEEEDVQKMSAGFRLLRKANPDRKVPFFWVETAIDGLPRLLVGLPSRAKVKNSESNPLRRTARNRTNIAEGLAWRDPSQGITFSVLRGKFRPQKARKLIKRMEKAVGVRLGKITIEAMDTAQAAQLGKEYTRENEEENTELRASAKSAESAIEVLSGLKDAKPQDLDQALRNLPAGTITAAQLQIIKADGLERFLAAQELAASNARANQVELSPNEHNKLVSGAYVKSVVKSLKSRFSFFGSYEEDDQYSDEEEWSYDNQVHQEGLEEDQLLEGNITILRGHSITLTQSIQDLRDKYDSVANEILALSDSAFDAAADAAGRFRQHQALLDEAEPDVSTVLRNTAKQNDERIAQLQTMLAFYEGRQVWRRNDDGELLWSEHQPNGSTLNSWVEDAQARLTEAKQLKVTLDAEVAQVSTTRQARIGSLQAVEDKLLRLQMTPERRDKLDALIGARDARSRKQEQLEAANQIKDKDTQIRRKELERKKLRLEIEKIKSSFFRSTSKNKKLLAEKQRALEELDGTIDELQALRDLGQEEIEQIHTDVNVATDEKMRIDQDIRDLELRKKKSFFGKDSIQEEIDRRKAELEQATAILDEALRVQRTGLAEPMEQVKAAGDALTAKQDQREALQRDIYDLEKKLSSSWIKRSKQKYRARIDALTKQMKALDGEIETLSQERLNWWKKLQKHQDIDESIAKLKLDSQVERTEQATERLTAALDDAGLGQDEAQYKQKYAKQVKQKQMLTEAGQARSVAEDQAAALEQQINTHSDDLLRTTDAQNRAVSAQQQARAAAVENKALFDNLNEPKTSAIILNRLMEHGDTLSDLFPASVPEEDAFLEEQRQGVLQALRKLGIEDNTPLTQDQAEQVLAEKKFLLELRQEQLDLALSNCDQEADKTKALMTLATLQKQKKLDKENIATQNEHQNQLLERKQEVERELEKTTTERAMLKESADRMQAKLDDAIQDMERSEGTPEYESRHQAYLAVRAEAEAPIKRYQTVKGRMKQLKKMHKASTVAVNKVTKELGEGRKGLIGALNKTNEAIDKLLQENPGLEQQLRPDPETLAALEAKRDDAMRALQDKKKAEKDAQDAFELAKHALNEQETAMRDKIVSADKSSEQQETLQGQVVNLHQLYEQQDEARATKALTEADGLIYENRRQCHQIHEHALMRNKDIRSSMEIFKNIEDIYEASVNPETGYFLNKQKMPSQLQTIARDNPEQYAIAMHHAEEVIADVERLKALGEPPERYLLLLDPIPRAFWPDSLVSVSKDFAEIEALFADELSSNEDIRTQTAKNGIAADLTELGDVTNTITGLALCSTDFLTTFAGATANTATVAWPIASTLGVLLSATDMTNEIVKLLATEDKNNNVKVDPKTLEPLVIQQLRAELEKTTLDKVAGLGENATDLVYKSAFATECILSSVGVGMSAGSTASMVPGIGLAATTILLAYKLAAVKETYEQLGQDRTLEDDMAIDEESWNDISLRKSMRNHVKKSQQKATTATIEAAGTAAALAAQASLLGTGAAAAGSTAIAWLLEAAGGGIAALYNHIVDKRATKRAEDNLRKARAGSRRAMMDIFENSQLYATQLMLKRASGGNSMAIRFCESRGLAKGDLLDQNNSKALMRKFLLDGDGDLKGKVNPAVRGMWDSLNSARKMLDDAATGVQTTDPGQPWFNVQNHLIQKELDGAKERGQDAYPRYIAALEKLKATYAGTIKTWHDLQKKLEDKQRWQPDSFSSEDERRLQNIRVALGRLPDLERQLQVALQSLQKQELPQQWAPIQWAA